MSNQAAELRRWFVRLPLCVPDCTIYGTEITACCTAHVHGSTDPLGIIGAEPQIWQPFCIFAPRVAQALLRITRSCRPGSETRLATVRLVRLHGLPDLHFFSHS